jgi:ATP-binding cassette subfamily B protein
MSKATPSPTRLTLQLYWQYSKPFRILLGVYVASVMLASLSGNIILPLIFSGIVDLVDAKFPHSVSELSSLTPQVYWLLSGILFVSILQISFLALADYTITHVNPYILRNIEVACLRTIHRQHYEFLIDNAAGSLISKVKRFMEGYEQLSFNITRGLLLVGLEISAALLVAGYFVPLLGLTFLVWGITYTVVALRLLALKMKFDRSYAKSESIATGILADSVGNFMNVKVLALLDQEAEYLNEAGSIRAQALRKSWLTTTRINFILGSLSLFFQMPILAVSIYLWLHGHATAGFVVLVQTYLVRLRSRLADLDVHLKSIFRGMAGAEEMALILAAPEIVKDPIVAATRQRTGPAKIDYSSICFRYHPEISLFENFSLTVAAGEKLGIVGSSGAGKSSLVKLLLRFVDVQGGSILIDGINIKEFNLDDLRQMIAYVPQEPILFHRTIRENIGYGLPGASDSQIEGACKRAQLNELLTRLPLGLDTIVGERGLKLSGGERQRIAIARAIISDAPILILDEPTAALDATSEFLIQQALDQAMLGRTTLVIAHRLATIQRLDRIILLGSGQIEEQGTHTELINRGGSYAELSSHQTLIQD